MYLAQVFGIQERTKSLSYKKYYHLTKRLFCSRAVLPTRQPILHQFWSTLLPEQHIRIVGCAELSLQRNNVQQSHQILVGADDPKTTMEAPG